MDRLYCLPGAETCYDDIATVWELDIEPFVDEHDDRTTRLVEEWTVHPPRYHLDITTPPATLLELILERVHDGGELTMDGEPGDWFNAKNPGLLAAAEALLDAIASTVTRRQCADLVATHVVDWSDPENPTVDGEPMYRKAVR